MKRVREADIEPPDCGIDDLPDELMDLILDEEENKAEDIVKVMTCRLVCKRWSMSMDVWWSYDTLGTEILIDGDMCYACAKGNLLSIDILSEERIANIDIPALRDLIRGYVRGGHLDVAKDGIEQFQVSRHDPTWQVLPALLLQDQDMDPAHASAFLAWFQEYCETNEMAQEEAPDYEGMVMKWM